MNTVQIAQYLLMKTGKLFIQPDDTVALAFTALFLMRAASAVLALVLLLGPSITVSRYGVTFEIMEFFCLPGRQGSRFRLLGSSLHGMGRHGMFCQCSFFETS